MNDVYSQLSETVDLQLPEYLGDVPPGAVKQLSFMPMSAEQWYGLFLEDILSTIGNRFCPIYRMADGEFILCVGRRPDLQPTTASFSSKAYHRLRFDVSGIVRRTLNRKEETCWGEQYSDVSRDVLIARYVKSLLKIANCGYLAMHFVRSPGRFSEQYIKPMTDWLASKQVVLSVNNYTAFYFVYAIMCGKDALNIIKGNSVLVVTSDIGGRSERILAALEQMGACHAQMLPISATRSLMEDIDLSTIKRNPDIILVAAGIGSANILSQLEPLQTLCIDIGMCLDIISGGAERNRVFTRPR